MSLWPHQERALSGIDEAIDRMSGRVVVVGPTGCGKTRVMLKAAQKYAGIGWRTLIYTHRKLLTTQTGDVFLAAGESVGILAAGHKPTWAEKIQVASVHTINSRCYKRDVWSLPDAEIVMVDEAHAYTGRVMRQILADHANKGAMILGFTATPVGLAGLYDRIFQIATNSELRACGAHVPVVTYAPEEVDLTQVKRNSDGEFVTEEVVRRVMVNEHGTRVPRIFGSVLKHLRKLNPELKPTILFAPDVASSRGFAQHLNESGVTAAHIDAETPDEERAKIIAGSKAGTIQVITNRFVMREGVDMPWLAHGILATGFGAISSYLQSGGRLLRSFPGLDHVTIQDHGGNWHRHGDLGADRTWRIDDTNQSIATRERKEKEKGDRTEGICCPECCTVRPSGPVCPVCGAQCQKSVRHVVQVDGTLKMMEGQVVKKKKQVSLEQKRWDRCYYRARHTGMTFRQAYGLFCKEVGHTPPGGLVRMPRKGSPDWERRVRDVPVGRLCLKHH